MDNQTEDKKYVCASCGSESSQTAGSCCGAERQEKSEGSAKKCENCGQEYKPGDMPACGCK